MAEKSAKKPGFFRRIGQRFTRFFTDTRAELKRVVWPTPKQVWNNLLIVLAFVALATALIFALDAGFGQLLQLMLKWVASLAPDSSSLSSVLSTV